MKWIVVGAGGAGALELAYVTALRRAGAEVTLLRADLPAAPGGSSFARRVLRRATHPVLRRLRRAAVLDFFRTTRERFDAVLLVKGFDLSPALIARCRELTPGAFWICYHPDDPFNLSSGASNADIVASIPLFDLYAIWSRRLVDDLRARGAKRVAYVPFAFDPETHPPPLAPPVASDAVCFVGAWDPAREATLTALVGHCNLRVYGQEWQRVGARTGLRDHVVPGNVYGRTLGDLTVGACVSLNLLRPQNARSHNMRTFEIPAMGGLQLTTRSAEQDSFFPEGEASFMFANPRELREQVTRILAQPELAARVRARGRELVQAHTYEARARQLIELVRAARST